MQEIKTPLTDEEKANMQLLEINNPDASFGVCCSHKVVAVGFNTLCYDADRRGIKASARITGTIVTGVTDPDKLIGSLVLPDRITEIGMFAFLNCSGLTSIIIPGSVTQIGQGAFTACFGLTCVTIPDTVTEIADEVFFFCGLMHIVIPDTVITIGQHAFSDCSALARVIIPHNVTEIGDEAFSGCTGLTELSVDRRNNVYYSEGNIIYTKDKKHLIAAAGGLKGRIVLPDGITKICRWAFEGCELTSIVIPGSVTEIDTRAFHGCWNLKTVVIESTIIKHIGETAFANVHTDVHFTVKTDAVKAMLKKNTAIRDENITVEPNL